MARSKRPRRPPSEEAAAAITKDTPVHPEVARFAERVRQQKEAERAAKQAERDARRRDDEHQQLLAAKDSAAASVKRLRTREHVTADEAAAAEAGYRSALAGLIAFETGAPPVWAPAPVVAEDPEEPEGSEAAEQAAGDQTASEEPGAEEASDVGPEEACGRLMSNPKRKRLPITFVLAALVALTLGGCGVSGKSSDQAAPVPTATSAAPDTAAPPASATTAPTSAPGTVPQDGSDTTLPATSGPDTSGPGTAAPFNAGDIRGSLLRIYKQSGFTDKEARCVTDLILKGSNGNTIDPNNFDFSKLSGQAVKCFGADGVPGGSD